MKLSQYIIIGLLGNNSTTGSLSGRICDLSIIPFDYSSLNEFEQMIICDLLLSNKSGDIQKFFDWKGDPSLWSIESLKSPVLEDLIMADRFMSSPRIRGPGSKLLMLLATQIASFGDAHLVNEVVGKYWRNMIAEFFIKTRPAAEKIPIFYTDIDDTAFMRTLVSRCGIVTDEKSYKNAEDQNRRTLPHRFDHHVFGSSEISLFCLFADKITSKYPKPEDIRKAIERDPKAAAYFAAYPNLEALRAAGLIDFYRAEAKGQKRLEQFLNPQRITVVTCYYELLPQQYKKMHPFDSKWYPNFVASDLSDAIIANLEMNVEELKSFCNLLKQNHDEKMIAEFALKVINRILDNLFEVFELHMGLYVPESFALGYERFVKLSALKQFDFSKVVDEWQSFHVVRDESKMCGKIQSPDQPRSSRQAKLWRNFKFLWKDVQNMTPSFQKFFCDLLRYYMEDGKRGWVNILRINHELQTIGKIIKTNNLTPNINRLCGSITRWISIAIDLSVLDGLVSIAGRDKACPIIAEWNMPGSTLTETDLLSRVRKAAEPEEERSKSMFSFLGF